MTLREYLERRVLEPEVFANPLILPRLADFGVHITLEISKGTDWRCTLRRDGKDESVSATKEYLSDAIHGAMKALLRVMKEGA